MPQAIVVQGNLSDGFTFYGPYESFDMAAFSIEGNDGDTWIATLTAPDPGLSWRAMQTELRETEGK